MRKLVLVVLLASSFLSGCFVIAPRRVVYDEPVVVYRAPVVVQREVMFYPRYKEQRHHHRHHDRRDRRW